MPDRDADRALDLAIQNWLCDGGPDLPEREPVEPLPDMPPPDLDERLPEIPPRPLDLVPAWEPSTPERNDPWPMPGRQGEHLAEALLTNFGTKVFTALGDERSARFASALVGTELQVVINTATAPGDLWEEMTGRGKVTRSTNASWQPVLQPGAFLSGLRTGGPAHDHPVDAVVVRGDAFSDGRHWRRVAFRQVG